MFFLLERSARMVKPQYSKSVLILWTYLKTVLDLGLQSRIKISTKQATTCSYPGSFPQGSGINFCVNHFKYWACLNRSVLMAEPCLSLASFVSIKCPKSLRAVFDSVGRNDNVSILHDPVEVLQSHIEKRKDCEWISWSLKSRLRSCFWWCWSRLHLFQHLSQSKVHKRTLQGPVQWLTFYKCASSNSWHWCCPSCKKTPIRIIDDVVTLRDGSNRRTVVYYCCDIFHAIDWNQGLILVVFWMKEGSLNDEVWKR